MMQFSPESELEAYVESLALGMKAAQHRAERLREAGDTARAEQAELLAEDLRVACVFARAEILRKSFRLIQGGRSAS